MTITQGQIAKILNAYPKNKQFSLAILQDMQRAFNYIPREGMVFAAEHLNCKFSELYAMATFYKALSIEPKGKTIIKVCDGTACHIRGSVPLLDALKRRLKIDAGETTADGLFTLETVNCLGACAIAPVMLVNETYHGGVTPDKLDAVLARFESEVAAE